MHSKSSTSTSALRLWTLFSVGKTTAIVVPILPLFLAEQIGLSVRDILHIATYFVLVPVLLEIPASWLGDHFGQRRVLIFGTLLFTVGFVALALNIHGAYPIYLASIGVAAACYSGCEPIYLRSILPPELGFTKALSAINEKIYLISAILLVFGGACYTLSPLLPLSLQIALLILALAALLVLPNAAPVIEESGTGRAAENPMRGNSAIRFLIIGILIVLYSGLFSGFVQLTSRTVQLQLSTYLGELPYLKIGLLFALGNLFSAGGSRMVRRASERLSEEWLLILGALLASCSSLLLSSTDIKKLIAGFFLLSIFKGFYRPPLAQSLRRIATCYKNQSTAYSFMNVFAVAIAALLHYGSAFTYADMHGLYAKLTITIFTFGAISLIVWSLMLRKPITHQYSNNEKKNLVHYFGLRPTLLRHQYADHDQKYLLENLYHSRSGYMPAPRMELKKSCLVACYVAGTSLEDCHPEIQLKIVREMTIRIVGLKLSALRPAIGPQLQDIFPINSMQHIPSGGTLIHADLHPGNVIVTGCGYQVIDWDSSGAGHAYFDLFTLISSPKLKIRDEDRINLVTASTKLSKQVAVKLITDFLVWKTMQMRELSLIDSRWAVVKSEYQVLHANWLKTYDIHHTPDHKNV